MEIQPRNARFLFEDEGMPKPAHKVTFQHQIDPELTTPSLMGIGEVVWNGEDWAFEANGEFEKDGIRCLANMMKISTGDLIGVVREIAKKKLKTPLN